jgi:putative intracellular protease/amidase
MGEGAFTEDSKRFMQDAEAFGKFSHSVQVETTHTDFDCVYLVGGHGCCVDFAGDKAAALVAVVNAQYAAGKVVAADCHGPYGLIDCTKADGTPLVAGLEVTAFSDSEEKAAGAMEWVLGNAVSMEQKFTEQGATFVAGADWGSHIKIAGNLITAQNPGSAPACAAAVIAALA